MSFRSCQLSCGIVALVVPLYFPELAAAQQDVTPPSLVSISVSLPSVDVTAGPGPVTVTADLTDDLSGVQQWLVQFNSPSGTQFVQVFGTPGLIAGNALNGTFQGTSQVAQFAEAGIWRATYLSMTDNAGNNTVVNLNIAGFPLSFTVVGAPPDTTPPSLSVTVSPKSLWPPNHKLVNVVASIQVSDLVDPNPVVTLVSIASNEPECPRTGIELTQPARSATSAWVVSQGVRLPTHRAFRES